MKALLTTIFHLLFYFSLSGQIIINEYSAANYDGFNDNYGNSEDWLELFNQSAANIDLNGYYLSDKPDNLTKWHFN